MLAAPVELVGMLLNDDRPVFASASVRGLGLIIRLCAGG